jgi:RNA polymerase sigma-70 factor (ECF subfamily)
MMLAGPEAGLARLAAVADGLDRHHLRHAVEGERRLRSGQRAAAAGRFARALELAGSEPERRFLKRRIAAAQP